MTVIRDIEIQYQSTPRLWMALREGYCGCGECKFPVGYGKTPMEALADLMEQEEEQEPHG